MTAAITHRRRPWWPWLTWLSAIGLASAASALDWQQLMPGRGDTAANLAANLAVAGGFPLAGAIILTHRPRHRIGVLLCAVGLASAITVFSYQYATSAVILNAGSLPFGELAAWISSWFWAFGVIPALTLLPLLFPNGDLPSGRWRPIAAGGVGAAGLAAIGHALMPGPLPDFPSIRNPIGIPALGSITAGMRGLVLPVFLLVLAAGVVAIVVRWQRGDALVRRQLGWFLSAAAVLVAVVVADSFHMVPRQLSSFVAFTAVLLLPAAVSVAVLRYRLYDIDIVVNRSLVYGGLTGGVIAIYVLVVTVVGRLAGQLGGSFLAAAAVAVAFQPLRQRLQGAVDRLMYGDRRQPYEALSRLASRLGRASSPASLLPVVAQGVSEALRVPGTRIEVVRGEQVLASATHGTVSTAGGSDTFPLLYQDHLVGRMLVSHRAPGQRLSGPDRRLLHDLLWHAGLAAHVVTLTSDLQRSREEAVAAREEERRHIRRDLHDGLGPALAGLALGLEGAHDALQQDRQAGEMLLADLSEQASTAIEDVRRVVYRLRPPSLDELGLLGAVREQANRLSAPSKGLVVRVQAPDRLPSLPAAVEVAAYRIAAEALTNVSRHAKAARCDVRIRITDALELFIDDDGVGIGAVTGQGFGLSSMAERAAELGGICLVEPLEPSGTRVAARLPMRPP